MPAHIPGQAHAAALQAPGDQVTDRQLDRDHIGDQAGEPGGGDLVQHMGHRGQRCGDDHEVGRTHGVRDRGGHLPARLPGRLGGAGAGHGPGGRVEVVADGPVAGGGECAQQRAPDEPNADHRHVHVMKRRGYSIVVRSRRVVAVLGESGAGRSGRHYCVPDGTAGTFGTLPGGTVQAQTS